MSRIAVLPQISHEIPSLKRLLSWSCARPLSLHFPPTRASPLACPVLANKFQPLAFEWPLAKGLPSVLQWGRRMGATAQMDTAEREGEGDAQLNAFNRNVSSAFNPINERERNDAVHICDIVCHFRGPRMARECYFQNYWLKSIQKYRRFSLSNRRGRWHHESPSDQLL
jgi:hypothetical protein